MLSPLAECAILLTICGRAISHSQTSSVERAAYGNASVDFWLRHEWLDGILHKRLNVLAVTYPVISTVGDSMLLFAFMVAQTTVIYLANIIEKFGADSQFQHTIADYQKRAIRAGQEIARLAKAHEQIGYIKVSHRTHTDISDTRFYLLVVTDAANRHIYSFPWRSRLVPRVLQHKSPAQRMGSKPSRAVSGFWMLRADLYSAQRFSPAWRL